GGTRSSGANAPKRGGTLVRASNTQFDANLDPHPLQPVYTSFYTMFYQTLLRLNPRTVALEPELALKWEQPSDTQYVLHLAPGVKFHNRAPANGREMTADDAVFSLNRVRTNDPIFQNRLLFSSVDKIEAVDKLTIRLTTKSPDVSTLVNIASFSAAILAPEVVEKAGKFGTPETAVGTGAFMLTDMTQGQSATVVRNPDYWKKGLPYFDSIKNVWFADQATAYSAFTTGQIAVGANALPGPDAKKAFDEQAGKSYTADWFKDVSYTSVQANVQRKPFDDPRVTKALRLLVDHDEAANSWAVTWFGRGYRSAYMPAALDEWDLSQEEYGKYLEFKQPKDEAVKEALTLLSAAGFSRDKPLKFTLTGLGSNEFTKAQAENHQAQLNKFGQGVVQVPNLNIQLLAILNQVLAQGNFEYSSANLVPAQVYDVDSWFTTIYHTGGGRNYGKYSDAKLDAMINKQRGIFEVNQRKAAVKDILRYMMDNAPYTSWAERQLINLESRKLHGYAPEGISTTWGYNYEQVWME
ncbi:MAG TPA: ABC transporter substrate-binding protein, partial [Dehalococcoidia bacterium]|nr:ABC transporter substrate-binding protein [Dehalococcoidia bacterium]